MTVDPTNVFAAPDARPTVTVEVWSDVVCPWCYIGKRRFASGLALAREQLTADGLDVEFDVSYHPYQLDPTASPGVSGPVVDAYAKKFGGVERAEAIIANVSATAAEVGLEFRMDRALRANTLLAHRVIWLAAEPDSPVAQDVVKERLLEAYFTDGLDIGDPDVLADCAAEVGFERDDVITFLDSDRGMAEVAEELRFAHENGITAVPTYVINGRWAVPGAQEPETFAQVLRKMAAQAVAEPA
jgi:predicted DsbA family dithiol-disulfide isomerase